MCDEKTVSDVNEFLQTSRKLTRRRFDMMAAVTESMRDFRSGISDPQPVP